MTMPSTTGATLKRRTGVELIRTGRWAISTGTWTPTREDLAAAVESARCPAVRNPVIKLGHTDKRFAGDGQPALGWYENLRLADGGRTLVADQVTLPWLHEVQAAAYPDRSVEGNYRHRCQLGHVHPFALTAVALLGVTPPGVGTLRSIQDLPDWLGVAASQTAPEGSTTVACTVRAADFGEGQDMPEDDTQMPSPDAEPGQQDGPPVEPHPGAMVALIPRVEDAQRLAVEGGEPAEQLHITLAYLGDAVDLDTAAQQDLIDAVSTAVNGAPAVVGDAFGVAAFNPGGSQETALVLTVGGDRVDAVHTLVEQALAWSGVDLPSQHSPWVAHLTLAYTPDVARLADLVDRMGPIRFDTIRIALAGQHLDIPLIDEESPAGEEPDADGEVEAADGNDNNLRDYWLHGKGLNRWADAAHPWTTLFRLLRPKVGAARAKLFASDWYRDHFGHMPSQRKPKTAAAAVPELPAAEPGNQQPEEDPVSELTAGVRQRLGLADDADTTSILAALDALAAKASTPATPDPDAVAAAAADAAAQAVEAERVTAAAARAEMKTEIERLSGELASIKAAAAEDAKTALFDAAVSQGRIKPADRQSWEARYDKAPDVIAEIVASIAPNTAVPVSATGVTGPAEPTSDADIDAEFDRLFSTPATAKAV